jgi:hypothetical protein
MKEVHHGNLPSAAPLLAVVAQLSGAVVVDPHHRNGINSNDARPPSDDQGQERRATGLDYFPREPSAVYILQCAQGRLVSTDPQRILGVQRLQGDDVMEKPSAICYLSSNVPSARLRLRGMGYAVREATEDDLDAILAFHLETWPKDITTLETPGQLMRLINYGLVLMLEHHGQFEGREQQPDDKGLLIGVNVNEHWSDGTQYGVRNTIHLAYRGQRLGALLPLAASEIGRERGMKMRRAIVSPLNGPGATNLLNHIGFVADEFRLTYPGETRPEFLVSLSLDRIYASQINMKALVQYCDEQPTKVKLIDRLDVGAIDELYRTTTWRIVAALSEHFVAVRDV